MNKEIRELLLSRSLVVKRIEIRNKIALIDTGEQVLVVKPKESDLMPLYRYLHSRSFDYFPEVLYQTENYDIYRYVEEVHLEKEEKASDIIKLLTLLHSKTTFYKEIDDDTYKKLYEDTVKKIEYLIGYYQDLVEIFEGEEYMSPSHYLFVRNVSKLFQALSYCRGQIDQWYHIIEEKKRVRITQTHRHLELDHYLLAEKPYLISWRFSCKDIPIYDLVSFYQSYYLEFDFCNLLRIYEGSYPMLPEERALFTCLISIPSKLVFSSSEFEDCLAVKKFYDYLFTTDRLMMDYFSSGSGKK